MPSTAIDLRIGPVGGPLFNLVENVHGIEVVSARGLGLGRVRHQDAQDPQGHAGRFGADYVGERRIVVDVEVQAPTDAALVAAQRALFAATPPEQDLDLVAWVPPVGLARMRVRCRRRTGGNVDEAMVQAFHQRVLLELSAVDGRLFSDPATVLHLQTAGAGEHGRRYPKDYPVAYSAQPIVSRVGDGVNAGNIAAPVTVTVNGPVKSPRLWNVTAARQFTVAVTVDGGSELVFSSAEKSVLLDGVDVFAAVDRPSQMWEMQPGSNEVAVAGEEAGGQFHRFEFRSAWA